VRRRTGFTLIEVLIVIVVIAILAAIVIPRLLGAGRAAREASLRADLETIRKGVALFQADAGTYPESLDQVKWGLVTPDGELPKDPVTGQADWKYDPDTGAVHSAATGNDLSGTPYSVY